MTIFAQRKANASKSARWQLWKILAGTSAGLDPSDTKAATVRLLQQAGRSPQTAIESEIMAVLSDEGAISYQQLVGQVADRLYHEELRCGGGASDIGLFGSRIFYPEVIAAIKTGVGELWDISSESEK
jgi:hypothetical protein